MKTHRQTSREAEENSTILHIQWTVLTELCCNEMTLIQYLGFKWTYSRALPPIKPVCARMCVHVWVCVCLCSHVCARVFTCECTRACVWRCMCAHVYVWVCPCAHVCAHVCVCSHVSACVCSHVCVCMCVEMRACTCECACVHVCAFMCECACAHTCVCMWGVGWVFISLLLHFSPLSKAVTETCYNLNVCVPPIHVLRSSCPAWWD